MKAIFLLVLFVSAVLAGEVDIIKFSRTRPIDGVYPKCRSYWLMYALGNKQRFARNPCPFGAYGAAAVNHSDTDPTNVHLDGHNCGKLIEVDTGDRGIARSPMFHAEIDLTYRLTDCNRHPEYCTRDSAGNWVSLIATDRTFWQQLSLYSNGESCVMDAAVESQAGYKEIIYGTVEHDYNVRWGWKITVLRGRSRDMYEAWEGPLPVQRAIEKTNREFHDQYFRWQFTEGAYPCPRGCSYGTGANQFRCLPNPGVASLPDSMWYPAFNVTEADYDTR